MQTEMLIGSKFEAGTEAAEAVLNPRTGKNERISRLVRMHANKREAIDEIPAGDIAAVIGLKNTYTGDTTVSAGYVNVYSDYAFGSGAGNISIERGAKVSFYSVG